MPHSLHELAPSDFARIRPLFPAGVTGHSFVAALLEGNHLGRVFVDDPAAPATTLVALACEFLYVGGQIGSAALRSAARSLMTEELCRDEYAVLFPTSDAWHEALTALFADAMELHHGARDAYAFDPARFAVDHGKWHEAVPEGLEIRAYDGNLAEGQGLAEFWGSVQAFLDRGIGYAVIRDGEAVSRCHSVMVGAGEAEISVETAEPYRRQGYAALAACAFIERCLALGLRPAWSNWVYSTASRRLAERLGFVHRGTSPALIVRLR
jgi:RimJ/RimL family protein N-acetyltransferase